MTLDEAIKHCEEKAKEQREEAENVLIYRNGNYTKCVECAEEHEQLAKWLKELKALKDGGV